MHHHFLGQTYNTNILFNSEHISFTTLGTTLYEWFFVKRIEISFCGLKTDSYFTTILYRLYGI